MSNNNREINIKRRPYFCIHNKLKYCCKECGGSRICCHGRYKQFCTQCPSSDICRHRKQQRLCKECDGSSLCRHGNTILTCKICKKDPSEVKCKHDKVNYCIQCYKTKEMNRIIQENINKRMKEWDVYFVKKHDSVKYCNEWCFYISDQDEIKKLRCDKCKQIELIRRSKINMEKDNTFNHALDFLIDALS